MKDWAPEELQGHLEKGDRVFLKLWKKGCGPCRLSTPAIERIEAADQHALQFGQICVDDHPEMFEITGVDSVPAFFIFKDRKMAGKFLGFKGLEKLKTFVDEAMA